MGLFYHLFMNVLKHQSLNGGREICQISLKHLHLSSDDEQKSYAFEWRGRVNDDTSFILTLECQTAAGERWAAGLCAMLHVFKQVSQTRLSLVRQTDSPALISSHWLSGRSCKLFDVVKASVNTKMTEVQWTSRVLYGLILCNRCFNLTLFQTDQYL